MAMSIKPNCDAMAMALRLSKALACLASFSGAYEDSEICARALDGRGPRGTFNLTVTVAVTFRTESVFFFFRNLKKKFCNPGFKGRHERV
jgi:hypothetical protein